MLIQLIRKDLLIMWKYFVLMIVIATGLPLFMAWRLPQAIVYNVGFTMMVIYAEFLIFQFLLEKENQYPKAATYLCATPYSRKNMVGSKYMIFLLVFFFCLLVYRIEGLFYPKIGNQSLIFFGTIFMITSAIFAIYMPIYYKLGFTKIKYLLIVVIMVSPLLVKYANFDFVLLFQLPNGIAGLLPFLMGLVILAVSIKLSVRIYERTELV